MITVINPATTIDKELIAPSISPISNAFVVPIACAAFPQAKPMDIGCVIAKILQTAFNMIAPKIPVNTTIPTVNVGFPPISSETPIAIAVVIDFGKRESVNSSETEKSFATLTTVRLPASIPEKILTIIAKVYFFKSSIFRYMGTAKLIVAGVNNFDKTLALLSKSVISI